MLQCFQTGGGKKDGKNQSWGTRVQTRRQGRNPLNTESSQSGVAYYRGALELSTLITTLSWLRHRQQTLKQRNLFLRVESKPLIVHRDVSATNFSSGDVKFLCGEFTPLFCKDNPPRNWTSKSESYLIIRVRVSHVCADFLNPNHNVFFFLSWRQPLQKNPVITQPLRGVSWNIRFILFLLFSTRYVFDALSKTKGRIHDYKRKVNNFFITTTFSKKRDHYVLVVNTSWMAITMSSFY